MHVMQKYFPQHILVSGAQRKAVSYTHLDVYKRQKHNREENVGIEELFRKFRRTLNYEHSEEEQYNYIILLTFKYKLN